jgi:RNA polymerase sigma factor (sigma-70 family)
MAVGTEFEALLSGARFGEPTCWGTLYDRYAPLVIGYLRASSLSDPENVAGEVFLHLVRDLHRFEGDERAFRSWLLSVAHHRMIDARRAEQRRPAVPVAPSALDLGPTRDDAAAGVEADEAWRDLLAHLAVLTDEQREVVLLRVVAELSLEETAAVVGRTVGAVKALQHRAFSALRDRLRDSRIPGLVTDAHRV